MTRSLLVCALVLSAVFLSVAFSHQAEAANLNLAWDPSGSDVAGYKIYSGTASRDYSSSVDVGNQTSYTLTGLEDGRTYYLAVTAYNTSGVESEYSNEITNDGAQVSGSPAESPSASSDGGGGGGCFIATAAYGSYLAPQVRVLRDFRDRYLLTNGPGRAFVRTYYALSPPIADVIGRHQILRSLTRWYLTPIVYLIQYSKFILVIIITAIMLPLLYSRILRVQSNRQSS